MTPPRVGTRGSALALAQAGQVLAQMAAHLPHPLELEVIKTSGDRFSASDAPDAHLDATVQGLFTKELDEALLAGHVRAAIHSLKDLPTVLAPGLSYGCFLERGDFRDALISRGGIKFMDLPAGARVGTGSPRREAQVRAARPDLAVAPLRGNLDTRLRKLSEGLYDAVVVAGAGVRRLGREEEITEWLDPEMFLPAPAQGVLAVVVREGDEWESLLAPLDHAPTRTAAQAERSFLKALQGGCRVPVGALARWEGESLTLSGMIADPSQGKVLRGRLSGHGERPMELGEQLAQALLAQGAGEILRRFGRGAS